MRKQPILVEAYRFLSNNFKHTPRTADFNVLILGVKNTVYLQEEETKYELHEGEILILEAGKQHVGYAVSPGTVVYYWIHFKGSFPEEMKHFRLQDPYHIHMLFQYLFDVHANPKYSEKKTESILFQLFFEELSAQVSTIPFTRNLLVNRVIDWIHTHHHEQVSVKFIANVFGYNELYLSRIFKQQVGKGLKEYYIRDKLDYINGLLLSTGKTLSEIAVATGFSNYKSFLDFYDYNQHYRPSEMRKTLIQTNSRLF
jgi:Response regulator containing CheY-like receiver domain and AraC-type DNA-binding domain